jgi:hypothetical protein
MIWTLLIVAKLFLLTGFLDGQLDKITFNFYHSLWVKWPVFFNPKISYRNKYKKLPGLIQFTDQDGQTHALHPIDTSREAFLGSTTVFVWLTDAWHLFKVLSFACSFAASAVLATQLFHLAWWEGIAAFLVIKAINGISFSISYKL